MVVLPGAAGGDAVLRVGAARWDDAHALDEAVGAGVGHRGYPLVERPACGVVRGVVELDGVLGVRQQAVVDAVEVVLAAGGGLLRRDQLAGAVIEVDGGAGHGLLALRVLDPVLVDVVPDPVADLQRCLVAQHLQARHRPALAEGRGQLVAQPQGIRGWSQVPAPGTQGEADAAGVDVLDRVEHGARDRVLDLRQRRSAVRPVVVVNGALGVEVVGAQRRHPAAVVHVHDVHAAAVLARQVQVATGARAPQGVVSDGLWVVEPDLVAEPVAEPQEHLAVGVDHDRGQLGLRVAVQSGDAGERGAVGVHLLGGAEGVRPGVPARARADEALDRRLARVGQRLVQHRAGERAGHRVEGLHDRTHVRLLAGGLAGADAADVDHAVLHPQPVGPPVARVRAGRTGRGDRVDALGPGGRGLGGVIAVELLVGQVDDVQVLAVGAHIQVTQRLLADRGHERRIGVGRGDRGPGREGDLMIRGADIGHGGEQGRRPVGRGPAGGLVDGDRGQIDRTCTTRTIGRVAVRGGRGEDPLVRLAPADPEQCAGVGVGRQVRGLRVGAARVVGEGQHSGLGGRIGAGGHARGGQRSVLLAVVVRVPQARGVGDVRAAGEVDELLVAAQLGRRPDPALDGGERGEEHLRVRIDHLDPVLTPGQRTAGRAERHRAVSGGAAGDGASGVVGQVDLHTREPRFEDRVVDTVRGDRPHHPHGHRPVPGTSAGDRPGGHDASGRGQQQSHGRGNGAPERGRQSPPSVPVFRQLPPWMGL